MHETTNGQAVKVVCFHCKRPFEDHAGHDEPLPKWASRGEPLPACAGDKEKFAPYVPPPAQPPRAVTHQPTPHVTADMLVAKYNEVRQGMAQLGGMLKTYMQVRERQLQAASAELQRKAETGD